MKEIPPERKALYYIGMVVAGIGLITFLSVFISGAMHFGDFSGFEERSRSQFTRAIVGMVLVAVGAMLRGIGARGSAGSGLVLDPKKAEEDLEPWDRVGGGLVKDALDEVGMKSPTGAAMPFDEKLRRLEALRKEGLLSDAEYQAKRREVLAEKL